MIFWLAAVLIPSLAALALCWPMLRQGGPWLGSGACLLLLIPVTTLLLYQGVGAPEGIDVGPAAAAENMDNTDVDALLAQLQARLDENPDNLEGWMLLGRSLKSMHRYAEAESALRRALALAPEDPVVQVELAEALIFNTRQGDLIDPEARQLLAAAVQTEPQLQKGLWLLGMTDFQAGDYPAAIERWETLLPLLPPGSNVAASVESQLAEARTRNGETPAQTTGESGVSDPWPGLEISVAAPASMGSLPETAVLYVIARDPAAPAPPLGVVRVPNPAFPLTVKLDDGNSMLPARPVSGTTRLEVLARLSLSGAPLPGAEDPASEPVIVDTQDAAPLEISLEQPGQ